MDNAAVIISALGGFGGIAAVISSLAAFRKVDNAEKAVEKTFTPNHGSSLIDKVGSVERHLDLLCDELRLLGESSKQTHALIADRLTSHDREIRDMKQVIDEKCNDKKNSVGG